MKLILIPALAAVLAAPASFAADSTERTTMPEKCSERDANCVVQDGAPPRRAKAKKRVEPKKQEEPQKRGNTPPGMDRSGGGPASGAIVDPAGVTRK